MDADSQSREAAIAAKARRDFPTFFANASPEEASFMDALLLARLALRITSAVPRRNVAGKLRVALEKATDGIDGTFAILRETVRASPAYSRMAADERSKLEVEVLTVSFPEEA